MEPKPPEPIKTENSRNVEQDRLTFIEAIQNIEISEIDTEFDKESAENLVSELAKSKLLLLGEMHGVKENADIIYTLFKKFGFRQLALEWEPELQDVADKFLESGELDFNTNVIKDSPDGRITAGHFALIKKLKAEGMLERLVCFNESSMGAGWDEGDINMTKNILAKLSDAPMLAVAGYLHAETTPVTFDDGSKHHPMGENVKKQISNVPSGKIEYLNGQYHNYGTNNFEEKPKGAQSSKARFYKSDHGIYLFELLEAHAAIVPNPKEVL